MAGVLVVYVRGGLATGSGCFNVQKIAAAPYFTLIELTRPDVIEVRGRGLRLDIRNI